MRQEHFEKQNRKLWNEFNIILKELTKFSPKKLQSKRALQLPFLYRQICNHYALALSREYSPALVDYLHSMALEGHQHLYRYHTPWFPRVIEFISIGFPRALRQNIIYFVIALSVFLLPALLTGYFCYQKHELIYSILSDDKIAQIEYMYDPSNRKVGRTESRGSDTNVAMFGFYIKNNTGIGFRTFAGGMLAGVGTLFFLLYNGILLGGISGYITRLGFNETFWPFVSGHGAFELTAIVISGASGLMLAHAVIAPGNKKRIQALKKIAPDALKLIIGAAIMFFIAAFIEAFWSSSSAAIFIKYIVAAILWLLVILYFLFAGVNGVRK
ncbi:MAG: stage II sporulation protein M [Desulfobacteraceae bacterium]|nr:stage II sporulation protein M [Desulfobacteraceae bacterium]